MASTKIEVSPIEHCPINSDRVMCGGCPGQNPNARNFTDWQPSTSIEPREYQPIGQATLDVNATGTHSEIIANPADIDRPNRLIRLYAQTVGRIGRWATLETCCIGNAKRSEKMPKSLVGNIEQRMRNAFIKQ